MDYDKIFIIIPSYEPNECLLELCEKLFDNGFTKAIIVDDGSSDEYKKIFDQIESQYGFTVLRHAVNLGKGRALKDAFNYILNIYPNMIGVVTADSDGQHKPDDIKKCMDALLKHPKSFILGCREFQGEYVPWKSQMGNVITKMVFRHLCGINISDTQTGLRGIPREMVIRALTVKGERFDYETNLLLEVYGEFEFIEVPIETIYNSKTNHKTHFDPFRDSIMIYKVIVSYSLSSFLSVLIDFSVFSFMIRAGINVWLATALGRMGTTLINFSVNRNVVFRSKASCII